jgi:methylamine dehydrogenase heavy chain
MSWAAVTQRRPTAPLVDLAPQRHVINPKRRNEMKVSSLTLTATCSALALAVFSSYAISGGAIPKQLGKEGTATLEDNPKILSAPPSDARRVYVTDPDDFNVVTRIVTIDGNNAKLLAQSDTGLVPNPVVSSDGKFFALRASGTTMSKCSMRRRTSPSPTSIFPKFVSL